MLEMMLGYLIFPIKLSDEHRNNIKLSFTTKVLVSSKIFVDCLLNGGKRDEAIWDFLLEF